MNLALEIRLRHTMYKFVKIKHIHVLRLGFITVTLKIGQVWSANPFGNFWTLFYLELDSG